MMSSKPGFSPHLFLAPLVLGVLPLLTHCSGSWKTHSTPPSNTGLSSAQIASLLVSGQKYPAALVVKVTTTSSQTSVMGVRTAGGSEAVAANAAFPMGSMTKSMTATLAAILVQEGKLFWTSKPADILPELAPILRSEYASVTLADLLGHRGGIYAATTLDEIAALPPLIGTPTEQRLQLASWLVQQTPSSAPTVTTNYSNGGYVLAGAMIERAGGGAYESLLQAKLFAPMGETVSFGTTGVGNEPISHHLSPSGAWIPVLPSDPAIAFPAFGNPAGGTKLSASAFARYLQMHLRCARGITGEVITPSSAKVLHTVIQNDLNMFALGWSADVDSKGQEIRFHAGSNDYSYYGVMAFELNKDSASAVVVTGLGGNTETDASVALLRLLQ